jgi:uncharacterized protein (TIGR03437 family)
VDALPGRSNYLIGRDPGKWRLNVPQYERVRYESIYPGINLEYYGTGRTLEYDFIVAPGADPGAIRLRAEGADSVEILHGDLVFHTQAGDIRQHAPRAYQRFPEGRRLVTARFVLEGGEARFVLGKYDSTRPLVIDPVLSYAAVLGGSGTEAAGGVAVDTAGNVYLTGSTASADFPVASPAYPGRAGAGGDIFVTKLNSTGTAILYSTYIGGSNADTPAGIAVDATGNVYVAGTTISGDFPTTAGAYQTTGGTGLSLGFVLKLNAAGSALAYSSYFGGTNGGISVAGFAVNSAGNAFVSGYTSSYVFPVTTGAYRSATSGYSDVFVTKFDSAGSGLVYSCRFGGTDDNQARALAVDSSDNAYVAGYTSSANFPVTTGALRTVNAGAPDAFVTKLNSTGTALLYSTYFGGSGADFATAIALDPSGNVYIGGTSYSSDLPGSTSSSWYGFVSKLDLAHGSVLYTARPGLSAIGALAADAGHAYIGGTADYNTSLLPTADAFQLSTGSSYPGDGAVAIMNSAGARTYATFLGGASADLITGMALDASGSLYVTGNTSSVDFPIPPGAYQTAQRSGQDVFLAKFSDTQTAIPYLVLDGSNLAFTSTLTDTATIPAAQTIAVTSTGSALPFAVYTSSTGSWLSATPSSGTTPGSITVSARPAGLTAGTYYGAITIVAAGAASGKQTVTVSLTVSAPQFSASQSSLALSSTGPAPVVQTVSLSTTGKSVPFTVSTNSTGWLSVTASSTSTPANLSITADPTGLGNGVYTGIITVSAPYAQPSTQNITVTYTVGPQLVVSSTNQNLYYVIGGSAPAASITVSSTGAAMPFTAVVQSGSWLTVSPSSGSTPAVLAASVNAAGLAPGYYSASVLVVNTGTPSSSISVPLSLYVMKPTLSVNTYSLGFTYQLGSATPAAQLITVSATSGIGVALTASASTSSGGNWLSVSPASATTPGTLTVSVNPTGLTAGTYQGYITIGSTGIATAPAAIPVTLTVGQQVTFTPTSLALTVPASGGIASQTLLVGSSGSGLTYTATPSVSWLSVSPATGTVPASLTVTANATGLTAGSYSGYITISTPGSLNSSVSVSVYLTVGSALAISRSSLSFAYVPGGTTPAAQAVTVTTGSSNAAYTAVTSSAGNWLSVDAPSGTTPATFNVSVNPVGLTAGFYSGTVRISAPSVSSSYTTISVTLTVGQVLAPSSSYLNFAYQPGDPSTTTQTLTVSATGPALPFTAVAQSSGWLSVTPAGSSTPATLTVTVNPAGLAAGSYTGTIVLAFASAVNGPISVTVNLNVAATSSLTAVPASLAFYTPVGQQASQTISLQGGVATTYSVSLTAPWVTVAPGVGTTPATLTVTVPGTLSAGTYGGSIRVSADGAVLVIPFTVVVSSAATPASVTVAPESLAFSWEQAQPAPAAQTVNLTGGAYPSTPSASWLHVRQTASGVFSVSVDPTGLAAGGYIGEIVFTSGTASRSLPVQLTVTAQPELMSSVATVPFSWQVNTTAPAAQTLILNAKIRNVSFTVATPAAKWLKVTALDNTTPTRLTLVADPTGLTSGTYKDTVVVTAKEAANSPFSIPVTLTVSTLPTVSAAPSSLVFTYDAGQLVPSPQTVAVAADLPLAYTVSASVGWLLISPAAGTSPGTIQVSINPAGLATGTYDGAVYISAPTSGNGFVSVPVKLTVSGAAPVVIGSGIVNAASYLPGPVAPGSMVAIQGMNLALSPARSDKTPLPTTLGDVSVAIDGVPAPLFQVSPALIVAQIPYATEPGTAIAVVTVNGKDSSPAGFTVAAAAPGIFVSNANRALAANENGKTNDNANPAAVGSVITAYATGQGSLDVALADGEAASAAPLRYPLLPVTATIGGRPAEVIFAGLAPGMVGSMQVNLRVPDLDPGTHSLVVSVGGAASNSAQLTTGR